MVLTIRPGPWGWMTIVTFMFSLPFWLALVWAAWVDIEVYTWSDWTGGRAHKLNWISAEKKWYCDIKAKCICVKRMLMLCKWHCILEGTQWVGVEGTQIDKVMWTVGQTSRWHSCILHLTNISSLPKTPLSKISYWQYIPKVITASGRVGGVFSYSICNHVCYYKLSGSFAHQARSWPTPAAAPSLYKVCANETSKPNPFLDIVHI